MLLSSGPESSSTWLSPASPVHSLRLFSASLFWLLAAASLKLIRNYQVSLPTFAPNEKSPSAQLLLP